MKMVTTMKRTTMKRTLTLLTALLLAPLAALLAPATYMMKKLGPIFVLALALLLADRPPAFGQSPQSTKKGVGLAERHGLGVTQLQALDVAWYYNWGSETKLKTGAVFVPMIFSEKHLGDHIKGDTVLGFNEPDNAKQSNLSAKSALAHWNTVAAKAKNVGTPAMAGNPLHSEWLADFFKAKPKTDFITVHWYKGADAKHFIRDLDEIHAKYGKPVWVTEFAPQTAASSEKEPGKFTQAQVAQFIRETIRWMEATPWVQRYAWHDSRVGTSALFDAGGTLTETGTIYAATKHTPK